MSIIFAISKKLISSFVSDFLENLIKCVRCIFKVTWTQWWELYEPYHKFVSGVKCLNDSCKRVKCDEPSGWPMTSRNENGVKLWHTAVLKIYWITVHKLSETYKLHSFSSIQWILYILDTFLLNLYQSCSQLTSINHVLAAHDLFDVLKLTNIFLKTIINYDKLWVYGCDPKLRPSLYNWR